MAHDATSEYILPSPEAADENKYTVVLDLDETLIYAREGPLYARPGLEDFLTDLSENCEIVVWTAGLRAYAQAIIRHVDPLSKIRHCIYRHAKWFTGKAGYRKDLRTLGRTLEKTIIIENTPDCIRGYQQNGVLVSDYEGGEHPDYTIPALSSLVSALIESSLSVQDFLESNEMLEKISVKTDVGDYIQCYALNVNEWRPKAERTNRDLEKSTEQEKNAIIE